MVVIMKYMSSYEIFKLIENLDKEYLTQAKAEDNIHRKKFAQKAHFVMSRVKREFKKALDDRAL